MADYATACKYDELETIGRGRFGVVKKVERRMDQKEFACKVITVVQSPHDPSINDAKHEYEILRALHHPNIVEYVDFERSDQEAKIYMELCRGGNLKDWIRARSKETDSYIPEPALWSIVLQLTSALTYCHFGWNPTGGEMESSMTPNFRTVLHRDLKPANVLISSTDGPLTVKLGDFGLAKFMDLEHTLSTFAGTKPYLAPEIVNNEATGRVKWTKHSDVYSLGCIVYEICTLDLLLDSTRADFHRIPASYSDSVRGFIGSCLSTEPSHRPDARELFQWAVRCCGNGASTPGEIVESLTANPSTIGLLDQQLLGGVKSLSELSPSLAVHVQNSNQQNFWIDNRYFPDSPGGTRAWPMTNKAGFKVLNQPIEKDEALADRQHGVVTLLHLGGFDASNPSFSTEAAFSWAIRHGLWNLVRLLMGQGLSAETRVSFRDETGQKIDRLTQNSFEAYNKILGLISSLGGISHPQEMEAFDLFMTPIHHATLQRSRGGLDLLINAGADMNAAAVSNTNPKIKMSALMIAATLGDEWMIRKLLEAGADPSLTFGADILSPLIVAVKMGLSESIIKFLIEGGAGAGLASNGIPASLNATFWAKEEAIKIILLECVDTSLESSRVQDLELPLQRVLSDAAFSKHHTILRSLLDRGIAIEFPGYQGRSPFLLAAGNGDLEAMKLLMDKEVDIKATDDNGCTALHLVALCSADETTKEEAVELLIKAGVDVNARESHQCTPLHYSACQDSPSNATMIKILLKHGADAQAIDEEGGTPLMRASFKGTVDMMKMLLQSGADVTAGDRTGCTALHFACGAGSDHEARFRLLQEYGAEITRQRDGNETPVHNCIHHCAISAVEELFMLYPAAVELACQRMTNTMNAMDLAAACGKREHLEFLLDRITDIDMESKSWVLYHAIVGESAACVGLVASAFEDVISRAFKLPNSSAKMVHTISTPLHQACYRKSEVALLILEHGADVSVLNDFGWAPLHYAVAADSVTLVRELLKRDKEIMSWTAKVYHNFESGQTENDRPPWMLTSLHIAVTQGATEALEALLSAGADINEPTHDEHGFTPLHLAVSNNHLATFHSLLSKGADHNKASKKSQTTPLLLALHRGHEEAAVELIYLGAQTSWTRPDGSTVTAWNMAAEKGFTSVTTALLGRLDESRHHPAIPQIETLEDTPLPDNSEAEDADNSTYDGKGNLAMVESMLEGSKNVIPAEFDKTVIAAVKRRDLSVLQRLADYWQSQTKKCYGKTMVRRLDSESSTVRSGRDGLSEALREAASAGLTNYIRPLMGICGWMIEFESSDGFLPIHAATLHGHGEFLRRLLSETKADVDQEIGDGTHRTALHLAVLRGHLDVVETLLSHGAAVDRGDQNDWSGLHVAAQWGNLEIANLLIRREADVNKQGSDGYSPLMLAAGNGHLAVVEALLDAGATVDDTSREDGWTALMNAARKQEVEVVEALLKAGADPNQRANNMETPLIKALSDEDDSEEDVLETVKMLLESGADVEACGEDDWSALRTVVSYGWTSIVNCLLEHKADIHAQDGDGDNALQIATMNGFGDIVEMLLEQGADIARANNDGYTPLHSAALNGHYSTAELLIQKGAEIDALQPENGSTPMHLAAEAGHLAAMQVLHFYGADITLADNNQMTPLLLAINEGFTEAATFLVQQKININQAYTRTGKAALHLAIDNEDEHLMKILLQHGADPNVFPSTLSNGKKSGMCSKLRNPVFYSVDADWLAGIQLLLKHNADVNSNWVHGGTALHEAISLSQLDTVRLLLENGAKVDIWDGRRAPLHIAAASGDKGIIEALLEYGADPNDRDLFGLTPLDIAKREPRCEEAIRILEPVTKTKRSGWKIWKWK